MKFFKLVDKKYKCGDIIGYEGYDSQKGILLKPTPLSMIHNDSTHNIAEVKTIGRMIPNGEVSGMYFAECVVIKKIFNTKDIVNLYDDCDLLYKFTMCVKDPILESKAFDKLYMLDDSCNYLIKYSKVKNTNKCKVLTKIMAEDKIGDKIYKFGLACREFAPIIQNELIVLNNLYLLVEYTKYVEGTSAWKTQTTLLSNDASAELLFEFALHNSDKEIDIEAIRDRIEEKGGDVDGFVNKFKNKIERVKSVTRWWDVG